MKNYLIKNKETKEEIGNRFTKSGAEELLDHIHQTEREIKMYKLEYVKQQYYIEEADE